MGYGQHQSFYLRDRWLSKAIKPLKTDERFFYDKDAFEKIGLGKNMVQSLRFWVVATGIIEEKFNDKRKKVHHLTRFGKILDTYDKFIQFNETASIIHYHLVKEKEPSTVWYWFFNELTEKSISKEELFDLFVNWVNSKEEKTISERSLKRDIDCLIKLYTSGQKTDDPEEVIQSPINKIQLLKENKGIVFKTHPEVEQIGLPALMYSLLDYKKNNNVDSITVSEITYQKGLWGKVFNMKRSEIIDALTILSTHSKYPIKFVRTNNLDTVHLPNVSPLDFIEFEYKRKLEALV
ncbi:DUF4007 family protein [Oceanobacillus halotolerans]|uniref:DUF4007 family protein n=1 Tax=Oceanobacillus halotolerans TaxID=2663380 RepID=UPI0013DA4812|nr:DUF4007 family protein [Oceanobacillus halotolerans]